MAPLLLLLLLVGPALGVFSPEGPSLVILGPAVLPLHLAALHQPSVTYSSLVSRGPEHLTLSILLFICYVHADLVTPISSVLFTVNVQGLRRCF